ncbi:MAG: type II secretion system protein [Dehalococcoidales bacterium]|nr:type II secretion system protein [Dehalococcoidales bacterium]
MNTRVSSNIISRGNVHFNSERGSGLVELLVAVAIVGTALAVFIAALSTGSLSVAEMSQETISQRLAQSQIEQTKSAAYDATGASYTLVPAPSGYSISLNVDSSIYADNKIQKLTVTISHDAQQVLVMEDYKVDR